MTSNPGIGYGCHVCVILCHFITRDLRSPHCNLDTDPPVGHAPPPVASTRSPLSPASLTVSNRWQSPIHFPVVSFQECYIGGIMWPFESSFFVWHSSLDILTQMVACLKSQLWIFIQVVWASVAHPFFLLSSIPWCGREPIGRRCSCF